MASPKGDSDVPAPPFTPPPAPHEARTRPSEAGSPVVLANQRDERCVDVREATSGSALPRKLALEEEEPLLQDNDERFCLLPVKCA